MKIYYFHPETGIYQGEGFEEKRLLSKRESNRAGMTNVTPPAYERGWIPVFDCRKATWSVVSIAETAAIGGKAGQREG